MINCTCFHSAPSQPIRLWRGQISPEQDAKIREQFQSRKPMNEEPLALSADTALGAPVRWNIK